MISEIPLVIFETKERPPTQEDCNSRGCVLALYSDRVNRSFWETVYWAKVSGESSYIKWAYLPHVQREPWEIAWEVYERDNHLEDCSAEIRNRFRDGYIACEDKVLLKVRS